MLQPQGWAYDWRGDVWQAAIRVRQEAGMDACVVDVSDGGGALVIKRRTNVVKIVLSASIGFGHYSSATDTMLPVVSLQMLSQWLRDPNFATKYYKDSYRFL